MPNVVGSREGWKLYVVTGGVMVGINWGGGFLFVFVISAKQLGSR
jgi:hypothetical protein